MNITLKLYATLADYLPPQARKNAVAVSVGEAEPITDILTRYQLPSRLTHLVLVNGHYIAPEDRGQRCLQAGDELAVWPPIAGG